MKQVLHSLPLSLLMKLSLFQLSEVQASSGSPSILPPPLTQGGLFLQEEQLRLPTDDSSLSY